MLLRIAVALVFKKEIYNVRETWEEKRRVGKNVVLCCSLYYVVLC